MRRQIFRIAAAGVSATIPVDHRALNFQIGIGCVVSGTLTYQLEHTFDDVFDSTVTPTWFVHSSIVGKTANQDGNYAFPVAAVRVNVTAYTSGSVTVTMLQASGQG